MKILVVEDDIHLQKAIVAGLRKFGYAVDCSSDGEDAYENAVTNYYDAVVLDLNLPKKDGVEFIKDIRKTNPNLKILVVSARGQIEDIVGGLDIGANDYIVKPFNFTVMEARLRALLRRKFVQEDTVLTVGGLALDTAKKIATFGEQRLELTKKEYSILEYLFANKERVVSSEELIEHIWDSEANPFSNTFKVHLNALKTKLSELTGKENIIRNKRGLGYYLVWDEADGGKLGAGDGTDADSDED